MVRLNVNKQEIGNKPDFPVVCLIFWQSIFHCNKVRWLYGTQLTNSEHKMKVLDNSYKFPMGNEAC